MGNFIKFAFESIPSVAQSPLALVAYIAAVVAWTIVSVRIRRNRNLLKNLEKLRPQDRLAALELEMGTVRVPGGLTPSQWLRSQVNRYCLFGFGVFCFVVIVLFALSSWRLRDERPVRIEQKTSGAGSPAVQGVKGDVTITIDQSNGNPDPKKPTAPNQKKSK
jgi:hypothetical protein